MVAVQGISHVGIAVSNLEQAIQHFSSLLGSKDVEQMDVPNENVRIAMIRLGDTEIELLSPTSESGAIAKFIRERGEGIHHLAVRVSDVSRAIEEARTQGFRLVDDVPRRGAGGTDAAFVHPRCIHGVLLEFYSR
ncbi:MAG: methylmalonyl-CoA epimerase [Nitrososphaerota archaeon]|nr:methylmalonyl-CoA epimerase [Nitrososphaerota archaeon]